MRSLPTLLVAAVLLARCKRVEPAVWGEQGKLAVTDLDGTGSTLAAHARKVTVVALWNESCEPCMKELPYLSKVAESYAGDREIAILAVNVGDDAASARRVAAKLGLKMNVLLDDKGDVAKALSPGQVQLPTLATIDATFHVTRQIGFDKGVTETSFVAEKRARIEAVRRGETPPEAPMPPPAPSGSAGRKSSMTFPRVSPADFAKIRPSIRATMKDQAHLSDAQIDAVLADVEAKLKEPGEGDKITVPLPAP